VTFFLSVNVLLFCPLDCKDGVSILHLKPLFYPSDCKDGVSILHLELNNDANRLKHSLVILQYSFGRGISVAETLIKNLEALDPGIECFMPGFSSVRKFPDG
jgi:hypothetical protein